MRPRLTDAPSVLRRALAEARDDDLPTAAKAVAFSLFLTIPAAMLVVLGTFSLVADEQAVASLIDSARPAMPAEAASLFQDSLQRSTRSSESGIAMTVVGLALAAWTLTSAATTLMKSVTLAFDETESRGFVQKRLLAAAVVGALVVAAALVVGLLVLGPHAEAWVGDAVGAPTVTTWLWWTLQWPILVGGLLLAFSVVLVVGPDVTQRDWRLVAPGALVAVVVWLTASSALALYSARCRLLRGRREDLVVVDEAPEGELAHDLPPQPAVFAPDYAPEEISEIAEQLRAQAGLPKELTGLVAELEATARASKRKSGARA